MYFSGVNLGVQSVDVLQAASQHPASAAVIGTKIRFMFWRGEHLVVHVQEAVVAVQVEISVRFPRKLGFYAAVLDGSRVDVHRPVVYHCGLYYVVAVDVKQVDTV